VNAVFITKAIESNSGVVNDNPYGRGLGYNKVLEGHEKEVALGWSGVATAQNGQLSYKLTDKQGKPVIGAKVTVSMLRPAQKGYDYSMALNDNGDGRYSAEMNAPLKGSWHALISVVRGTDGYHDMVPLVLE
jgi:nitrogen fixation protein FixH